MKTVNINGVHIPLLINNRARVDYERMRGKSASIISTFEDALAVTYCAVRSGARSASLKFEMDFETFIDYTDAHPEIMKEDEQQADEPAQSEDDKKKAFIT